MSNDFLVLKVFLMWCIGIIISGFTLGLILTVSEIVNESILGIIGICYG